MNSRYFVSCCNYTQQVLGETQAAHDLGHGELLILGEHGILLVGEGISRHEEDVVGYLSLQAKHIFMSNFFSRHFSLMDTLQTIRALIDKFDQDPNSIPKIRRLLSVTSRELVQLEEMLGYLRESIAMVSPRRGVSRDLPSQRLQEIFDIDKCKDGMVRRVQDMQKNVASAKGELVELKGMADVVSEIQLFKVHEAVQANTKNLEEVSNCSRAMHETRCSDLMSELPIHWRCCRSSCLELWRLSSLIT